MRIETTTVDDRILVTRCTDDRAFLVAAAFVVMIFLGYGVYIAAIGGTKHAQPQVFAQQSALQ